MLPLLRAGDRVTLEPLDGPPRAGDILLILGRAGLMVHRVARVVPGAEGWRALMRGDASRGPDGLLGPREIVGRVALQETGGILIDHRRPLARAMDRLAAACAGRAFLAKAARQLLWIAVRSLSSS